MSFAREGAGVAPCRSQQSDVRGRQGGGGTLTLQEVPGEDSGFRLLVRVLLSLTLLVFVNEDNSSQNQVQPLCQGLPGRQGKVSRDAAVKSYALTTADGNCVATQDGLGSEHLRYL